MTDVIDFESAQENLARSLPGYKRRERQAALAHQIESIFDGDTQERHGLLQASTGTGKSLAYLIPAILSGKRVVVSTATKALQDQLANKDLPFLQEHLGVPFSYAVLKGRSNYLCLAKLEEVEGDYPELATQVQQTVLAHPEEKFLAERDDFESISDADWSRLSVSGSECPGARECPLGKKCLSEKAKGYAKTASVVVVNHALLMADLIIDRDSRGGATLLGSYDLLIVDEGHELADYATNAWGSTLREQGLLSLADQAGGFLERIKATKALSEFNYSRSEYVAAVTKMWEGLIEGRIRQEDIVRMAEPLLQVYDLIDELRGAFISATPQVMALRNNARTEEETKAARKTSMQFYRIYRRFTSIAASLNDFMSANWNEWVRWIEVEKVKRGRKWEERLVMKIVPITVGKLLNDALWKEGRPCLACNFDGKTPESDFCENCDYTGYKPDIRSAILSATLAVGGRFDFVSEELGINPYVSFDAGTPFDFRNQCRLYIPSHLPEPNKDTRVAWENQSIVEIRDLIKASDGRALVLFTSTKQMKTAFDLISKDLPYTCLIQGSDSNRSLAQKFKEDTHSVLFATRSFFTGVDFSGSTCSLVVIDKLPFPVPTDPIIEAKSELIRRRGGNDFMDFTVPVMTLILQQGFGRLIRHEEDTGVVAILDRRLTKTGWGKKIVASLPDAPVVTSMDDVESFFAST